MTRQQVTPQAAPSQDAVDPRKSRWIPWVFVGLFGICLTANGIMIYSATSTWTGLTAKSAYRQGVTYNKILDQRAAARKLGWDMAVGWQARADGAARTSNGLLSVRLRDRTGAALTDAKVSGSLFRPVVQGFDRPLPGFAHVGGGLYQTRVNFPARGLWEVRLSVTQNGKTVRARHRLTIGQIKNPRGNQ